MAKILKLVLLGLLVILAAVNAQDNAEGNTEIQDEEAIEENDLSDIALELVDTLFFAEGVKFASGKIDLKIMAESIKTLAEIGSDLDQYEIPHRGVVVVNLVVVNKEIADKFFTKVNDLTHIMPYRYLRSNLECIADAFLGFACNSFFKRGADTDDYSSNITFSFGSCQEGLDYEQVRNIETVLELLTTSHKNMLANKLQAADEAAQQYDYYNKLYDDAVSKKNFAEQIPELNARLESKNNECDGKESEYNIAKSAYDVEKNRYETNLDKLAQLNNEIDTLTAQKAALENEQIQKKNVAITFETRKAEAQALKTEIQKAINIILNDVDPNFFNGISCVTDSGINQACLDILNRVR